MTWSSTLTFKRLFRASEDFSSSDDSQAIYQIFFPVASYPTKHHVFSMDAVSSVVIVLAIGHWVKDAVHLQSTRVVVEALLEVFGSISTLDLTSCEFVARTHPTLCTCVWSSSLIRAHSMFMYHSRTRLSHLRTGDPRDVSPSATRRSKSPYP